MTNSKTVQFHRGTIWAKVDGTIWVLGKDYDRLWSALTEIERVNKQIQLYSPCGCGSGEKFKFCCRRLALNGEGSR